MKKTKNEGNATPEVAVTEQVAEVAAPVAPAPATVVVVEKKAPGRPIVPTSKRQMVMEAKAEKIAAGYEVKKGRPINDESNRQIRLTEQNAKREAGLLKRGRPKMDIQVKLERQAVRLTAKAEAAAKALGYNEALKEVEQAALNGVNLHVEKNKHQ